MNDKINIIDALDEAGMLYLGLVELISAEVLVDIDSCHKAKLHLVRFQQDLPVSRKCNDAFVKKFLNDAEVIIERELHEFMEKQKTCITKYK